MKKIILSLAFLVVTSLSFATKPHIDYVKVNTTKSTIKWKGLKMTESHDGFVNLQSGTLNFNHGVLVGGMFVIEMNTITNTDIKSEEYRTKLEKHLKDADFFDVANHPTAYVKITNAVKGEGNTYEITADLTIKRKTHSITFTAEVDMEGLNFEAAAKIKIDRTKWGVVYNSGNFFQDLGDYLIKDEIELEVSLLSAE